MIKQLLIIFKILVVASSRCAISSQIPQLSINSANLMNINLNATSQDFTINANNTNTSTFALAVNQINIPHPIQWNLTVANAASSLIVSFQNANVNWIKIACIILTSARSDLYIGSSRIKPPTNGTQFQTEVSLNKSIQNFETSVVISFLNGLKINCNQSFSINISPFRVSNQSFLVNVTANVEVSYIILSYVIFSPLEARFEAAGDQVQILPSDQTQYFDVSQQIPNTPYKFYGFSGFNSKNQTYFDAQIMIDENFALGSKSNVQSFIEYVYFLPEHYGCSDKCNGSIVYDSTCNNSCPNGTVLINNGQIIFCKNCSESLHLIADKNQASCVCKEGYIMNDVGKCLINPNQSRTKNGSEVQRNQTFDCSNISNSVAVNNRCLCTLGYTNISNNCVPIVTLGNSDKQNLNFPYNQPFLPFTVATTTTQPTTCSQNQSFSKILNKCLCKTGFQMSENKCISQCSDTEVYNIETNSCVCKQGYARVNSQCLLCSNNTQYSSQNNLCYPLTKQYCRNNFILSNGYCVACLAIDISSKANQTCSACLSGFAYNGSQCNCLLPNQIMNESCVGPLCGNKKIDAGETCDDGNIANSDGCSSSCTIEEGYYCTGSVSTCKKSVCGNGFVSGGEQCDDNNTVNGDGCSATCLIEANYSCVGPLSSCFKIQTGNLTLISTHANTNNIFLIFETPISYAFPNPAFMQTFLIYKYLTKNINPGIVYCQQESTNLNRFDCLIIFPSGIPILSFIMSFSYNYNNSSGTALVYLSNGNKA